MVQHFRFSSRTLRVFAATMTLALPAGTALAIGGLGDIVYDPTNYAQAVKQVQAWEQQYRQMTQAIAKAEATYEGVMSQVDALTGVRGFGDILNNPALRAIIPADLGSTLSGLNSTGLLTGEALSLRTASAVYDCSDIRAADAKKNCQALLGQTAQAQAFQQETMALLNQRTAQIDALRAEINSTEDPKAIAELQARLAAEQAQVGNDHTKVAVAAAMLASSRQAAVQAEAERVNALMAASKTSALDGFSFSGLGYASANRSGTEE